MSARLRLLLVALALLGACRDRGQHASPDGREFPHAIGAQDRHAPTPGDLATLTVLGTDGGILTLTDGVWSDGTLTLQLLEDVRAVGDIDGDGNEEAAVVLAHTRGDEPPFLYVGVAGWDDGHLATRATVPLEPGLHVVAAGIHPGTLAVDVRGEAGSVETRTFSYSQGRLTRAAPPGPTRETR